MRNSAYVEIYGNLAQDLDIQFNERNEVYGIILVAAAKTEELDDTGQAAPEANKLFPVFIRNKQLLMDCSSFLKKGKKVWLVGELSIAGEIKKATPDKDNSDLYIIPQTNSLMINVTHKAGIRIVSNEIEIN